MFKDIFSKIVQDKGLSLYKLSKETNIPKSIVYEWASGKREPISEYLIELVDYLDVSVDYLLGRTDDQHTNNISHSSVNVVQGDNSGTFTSSISTSIGEKKDLSQEENEILDIYRSLNISDKSAFLNFILDMKKETAN